MHIKFVDGIGFTKMPLFIVFAMLFLFKLLNLKELLMWLKNSHFVR